MNIDDPKLMMLCGSIESGDMKVLIHCINQYPECLDQTYYRKISDTTVGMTPLMHAIFKGDMEIIKKLLESYSVEQLNKKVKCDIIQRTSRRWRDMTALNHAILLGSKDVVSLLLLKKANPNDGSMVLALFADSINFYSNPLQGHSKVAISEEKEDSKGDMIEMLLNAGANVNGIRSISHDKFNEFAPKTRNQLLSYAYDFTQSLGPMDEGADGIKSLLPRFLKMKYIDPESRWMTLDNLKKRLFPAIDESNIVKDKDKDKDKALFDQIQSGKEAIKERAKESLIERSKLDFNNKTIVERYRRIAQRMFSEYKDPAIEDALARIDTKVFAPTQVLPKDIKPKALEVLKEPGVYKNITGFLSSKEVRMLQDVLNKDDVSNMEISPRLSNTIIDMDIASPSSEDKVGGSITPQNQQLSHTEREEERRETKKRKSGYTSEHDL